MSVDNETAPPKKLLRIAVGSQNPAKIRAVKQALRRILQHKHSSNSNDDDSITIDAQGFDVASGVRDQPMGDEETCLGAKNRASAAYFAYRRANDTAPHLAFGLEGGLEEVSLPSLSASSSSSMSTDKNNGTNTTDNKQLYCMAWMAIYGKRSPFVVDLIASPQVKTYFGDRTPKFGFGKTGTFPIPPKVTELIKQGMELGPANDQVFQSTESKKGLGAVGLLTGGLVDRSAYYEHAIMLALTPWFRPDVYP